MALEFADKNVLIVDDSIVRGTTSKEIIQMAKDVGAKKVIVASCAPPIRYGGPTAYRRLPEADRLVLPAIPMSMESTCLHGKSLSPTDGTKSQ